LILFFAWCSRNSLTSRLACSFGKSDSVLCCCFQGGNLIAVWGDDMPAPNTLSLQMKVRSGFPQPLLSSHPPVLMDQ
jgi:hypothetical protein